MDPADGAWPAWMQGLGPDKPVPDQPLAEGFDFRKAMMVANALGVRPETLFEPPPKAPMMPLKGGPMPALGRPQRAVNYSQLQQVGRVP